jgi:hypothetical protein
MAEKVLPSSPSKHLNRPPEKRNLDKTLNTRLVKTNKSACNTWRVSITLINAIIQCWNWLKNIQHKISRWNIKPSIIIYNHWHCRYGYKPTNKTRQSWNHCSYGYNFLKYVVSFFIFSPYTYVWYLILKRRLLFSIGDLC